MLERFWLMVYCEIPCGQNLVGNSVLSHYRADASTFLQAVQIDDIAHSGTDCVIQRRSYIDYDIYHVV